MTKKLAIGVFVTFAVLIGISSFSLAMAISPIDPILGGEPTADCADLDSDLQILLENEIITESDVRDILAIFYCNNT